MSTAPISPSHLSSMNSLSETDSPESRSVPDFADYHLGDHPEIRPRLGSVVRLIPRILAVGSALAVGAIIAWALSAGNTIELHHVLLYSVVGSALLTAFAANWSTCGMSVAAVVAAPKQADRPGYTGPWQRLGAHLAGSLFTAIPTGAALGLIGLAMSSMFESASWVIAASVWAVMAVLYGLHEANLITMPTPMRRKQLPRHLRRVGMPGRVSFYFGMLIGPGFMIFIRSSAYYLLFVGVVMLGNPLLGAALFALVSVGRCGPSLMAIIHQNRGGSMGDFLLSCMRVDRLVQLSASIGLIVLASFVGTSVLMTL